MRVLWLSSTHPNDAEDRLLVALSGLHLQVVHHVAEALSLLSMASWDALIANVPVPDHTPDELIEAIRRVKPGVAILVRDPQGSLSEAVRLTKLGAFHFLDDRALPKDVLDVLRAANDASFRRPGIREAEPWRKMLVGESRAMQELADRIRLLGPRRSTVLITGETGTGKEMVARAVHHASGRSQQPLVTVNCSALPENLLEAELFGHVRGAFTGAVTNRIGRFEQANRGTIFLDEIADMPLDTQTKLLRVLQEREFQRLGCSETTKIDVRVIAACNVNLLERIRQGRFREDLFYRLNVVPVEVPPLRERAEDIPPLVQHFLEKVCRQEGIPVRRAAPETLARLSCHPWPGNVRQLENAVEMAVALSGERDTLYPSDFPLAGAPAGRATPQPASAPLVTVPDSGLDFEQTVGHIARSIIDQALARTGGNKRAAADMLRLKRTTLSAKLRALEAVAG